MIELRVTKYDPGLRDGRGAYTRDEWTSASDIGHAFAGVALTEVEYQRVEDAYVAAALAFMREADVSSFVVAGLENSTAAPLSFADGSALGSIEAGAVIRQLLREKYWCRLESRTAFVHVGRDFYMYIGVSRPCPLAEALARQLGLFVERCRSPYREE